MTIIDKPVLVLNNAYEPLSFCSVKRAVKLIIKGSAETEETNGQIFYSGKTLKIYLPKVIRLLKYRYIPKIMKVVTKKNIFNRDQHICMYCGNKFDEKYLTLDHIIPRSRGGKSVWENLVTCCSNCNRKKDNKLLSELSDMKLKYYPRAMNSHTNRFILRNIGDSDPAWRKYLFFETFNVEENNYETCRASGENKSKSRTSI